MKKFVSEGVLKSLNVAMALDEGLANPNKGEFTVFYGERAVWWIRIKATGNVGHGSRFINEQAVQKIHKAIGKFFEFRQTQQDKYEGHGCEHGVAHKLGDVVTVNCTMMNAGVTDDGGKNYALNVLPLTAEAGFDIRIPPSVTIKEMEDMLHKWCDPDGIEIEFVHKVPEHNVSSIDPVTNPWWKHFSQGFDELGIKIVPEIFPAGTDSQQIRAQKIP